MKTKMMYALVVEDASWGSLIELRIYDDLGEAAKQLMKAKEKHEAPKSDIRANLYWIHLNNTKGLVLRGDGIEDNIDFLARIELEKKYSRHKKWLDFFITLTKLRLRFMRTKQEAE